MDLSTTYMGMRLKNPIVPSASPLSAELDNIRAMEDAGAAAVVLFSLFEEQIIHEALELDHYLSRGTESFPEALTYYPAISEFRLGTEEYLEHIRKTKEAVEIPVIGSLNGTTVGGWMEYARKIQQAGADALELNMYFIPTDPQLTSAEIESVYLETLRVVKSSVTIPVAMKLSPFFTNMANMAKRLDDAGANALVLFNRFYQPDIDLGTLEVVPGIRLSTSQSTRIPLRWLAILYGRLRANLAATTGVHSGEDVLKMLMAGADVTMMCAALLKNGIRHISRVLSDMEQWMSEHEYVSVEQMKGSMSHKCCADPSAFERANYMKALQRFRSTV